MVNSLFTTKNENKIYLYNLSRWRYVDDKSGKLTLSTRLHTTKVEKKKELGKSFYFSEIISK